MSHYHTILAAIDLENNTEQVLKRVAELTKENNTKIIILHAAYVEIPFYGCYYGEGLYAPREINHLESQTREKASEKIYELLDKEGLSRDNLVIEFGRPEDIIIDVANKENVDLIVLGTHGRHGLGLLLGSTANNVLNKAQCDVLAVRFSE